MNDIFRKKQYIYIYIYLYISLVFLSSIHYNLVSIVVSLPCVIIKDMLWIRHSFHFIWCS